MSSLKRSVDSQPVLSSIHVTRTEIRYISLVVMHISIFFTIQTFDKPTNKLHCIRKSQNQCITPYSSTFSVLNLRTADVGIFRRR